MLVYQYVWPESVQKEFLPHFTKRTGEYYIYIYMYNMNKLNEKICFVSCARVRTRNEETEEITKTTGPLNKNRSPIYRKPSSAYSSDTL